MGSLAKYFEKRDFEHTPEPFEPGRSSLLAPVYSMQKHDATRLHYDLRLEHDGVLLSWAVTRGPSLDPSEKRLAVRTEDHPLTYLDFEGVISEGYGAGRVMLWDIGHWQPLEDVDKALAKGSLKFALYGRRNTGNWTLVRMKGARKGDARRENWLLIKHEDEVAHGPDPTARWTVSAATGRDFDEIGRDAPARPFGPERRKARPRLRKPQLATLTEGGPEADSARWHELKFDGYRALVAIGKGGARIHTRSGQDWSEKFAALIPAFDELPAETALIDGEIIAGAGLSGFGALQKAIKAGGPFTFAAFDLLHLDGAELAPKPLTERRTALERLFEEVPPRGLLRLSPVIEGDADDAFDTICGAGGEGLISKRKNAPYRGGRSRTWLKVKCERRAEFIIVGWQPSDKRGRAFSSLLLGTQEDEGLVYRGKVGTGFDAELQADLARRLKGLARDTPPVKAPKSDVRGARWLEPRMVAEIRYGEVTSDGRLRHPVFEGLREDKPAREVKMEETDERVKVAGIGVSSGDREVFPGAHVSKLDIARYYEEVAERMLEEAADRPLALVRMPGGLEGDRFFQKHAGKGFPDEIKRVTIEESSGKHAEYMYVNDAAGLVSAAQMGTIEFHVWGSRRDRLERPDRMVFDLDPDEGLGFADVKTAAAEIRDDLDALGLPSWPLVTGGKGVHVVVPLRRVAGWDTVKLFARTFAVFKAGADPDRYVANMSKAKRKGRIFLDYLRNERGATAIAPFSLRARPGAPVAIPVSWNELAKLKRADAFDIEAAAEREWPDLPKLGSLTGKVIGRLEDRMQG